ncbi:NADP-dependent oxidoreductase [Aliifodinibius sp. S!AR15-10]|uniref:NADP-dependent oxidoreductase n=1 Tax=Aliifodinibius sp. S!AR15-10 TaxID=2950437 RepID=UPI00285E6FFE|nr:NADP-dependent oxidoreductase [Aliifodinibius sp. S!AR15-10]MDR8393953.1 NADP-dependent oxidoreductase [Aliifodinibius sp. S!AR15-10]
MSSQMKASYFDEFGELDNIKTGTLERPEAGEGEVLVRVKAAGVNPVDAAIARGMLNEAVPAEFPAVPGWDMAGVVEECGFSARRFEEGDEVYAYARRPTVQHGTFAEYVAIPESYLAHRPQQVSMEESGGIPLVGLTAYQALFQFGNLQEGHTLLILGASGGVGTLAIQLAKAKGATVIGVASGRNQEYMAGLGADETIDYSAGDVGEQVEEVAPEGIDFIFHCSRGNSLKQSISTLNSGGQLVSITNRNPDVPDDISFQYVFVEPNAKQLQKIKELADEGHIEVPISQTYSLEETGKALREIESLHSRGKTIITP